MRTSDIIFSLFILIIFFVLYSINISMVGIDTIRNNWDSYKCNPAIIPFAWLFGKDTKSNMMECVGDIQSDNFSAALSPFTYIFGLFTDGFNSQNDSFASTFSVLGDIQNSIKSLFNFLISFVSNALFEAQNILLVIKDTLNKSIGIVITFIHAVNTMLLFTESALNSALVNTVFKLGDLACFHPDTQIVLENKMTKKISELLLNDVLIDNNKLTSIHKIKNKDVLYKINNTYITGNHYIRHNDKWIFVKDHPDSILTNNHPEFVYCIGTKNNTIDIDDHIYHDWNDDYIKENNMDIKGLTNCFHENTYLTLQKHIKRSIKHINIGDRLIDNNKIIGISTFNIDNTLVSTKNKQIICDAKQDILYQNKWIYAEDHPDFISYNKKKDTIVYSIITETRTIKLHNYLFKDSL